MGEEPNKELETEMTEGIREAASMETMEDYTVKLEASYKTLNQRHIEIIEEEDGEGEKWTRFAQMMEDRTIVKVKIVEVVKGGVVTSLEEMRVLTLVSQLSIEYMGKLEDWQGKYVETVIITVDPKKKRPVLSGHEAEKEKKEAQRKEYVTQLKTGDTVEGTMGSIKPYGVFIKLDDGMDGLLHVLRISIQGIKHSSAILIEGQIVKVKTLSTQEGKPSLSMKVLVEQQADRGEHETFDYKETGMISTELDDLLEGLKLQT